MSFLYSTGAKLNFFARGTTTVSPAAASVATEVGLYDNDPGTPMICGSVSADAYIKVDLQALTNPGFETSTLSGWTAGSLGTGTSAETTTAGEFRTGAKALKLTGTDTSNYGSRYQDIVVASGEYRKATVYIKQTSAGSAKLFLKCLKTGNYYNGSAWASTRAAAVTQAGTGSFVAMTVTYQVETIDTTREDTVSLRWELACEGGTLLFDDCLDVPGVTFAAIFGHNLGPVVPTVRSSDDDSSYSDRITMTVKRPAFFGVCSIIYAQYWRIVNVGTNHAAHYIGEAVLGQYQTSTTAPEWNLELGRDLPGARMRSPSGRPAVYNYATDPPQTISMNFSARTAAAARELADAIWLRSKQGLYPVVAMPIDTETDVYFGRVLEPFAQPRPFQGVYQCSLNLQGDPFPTVGL